MTGKTFEHTLLDRRRRPDLYGFNQTPRRPYAAPCLLGVATELISSYLTARVADDSSGLLLRLENTPSFIQEPLENYRTSRVRNLEEKKNRINFILTPNWNTETTIKA